METVKSGEHLSGVPKLENPVLASKFISNNAKGDAASQISKNSYVGRSKQ